MEDSMPRFLLLVALSVPLCACGATQSATRSSTPAPLPDVLFESYDGDPAVAACLAGELARIAGRDGNRQQQAETRAHIADVNARTSAEFAERARTQTAADNLRAQAAAAASPPSQSARAAAEGAAARAGMATHAAATTEAQAAAAARAKEQLARSARIAQRFTRLADAHAEIFELRSAPLEDRTGAAATEARALETIRSIGESNPELHWLYVEQFLDALEQLPVGCRHPTSE
jgi:hypothetical protein